jgi:hypothetical protein
VAGGTRKYDRQVFGVGLIPFRGLEQSYLFDPGSETWTRAPDMARGRWYPTLVTLPDGSILAMAGLGGHFPWYFQRSAEVFQPSGAWETRRGAALSPAPRGSRSRWQAWRSLLRGFVQHARDVSLQAEELPDGPVGHRDLGMAEPWVAARPAERRGGHDPLAPPSARLRAQSPSVRWRELPRSQANAKG